MDEVQLPENQCPLCSLKNISSIPFSSFSGARFYDCLNCGSFSISYMAYRFTPIINNQEIRVKLSYFIRHNTSVENPIYIQKDNYEDMVNSVALPTALEKLDNLLLWFGENSKYSFNTVDGHISYLRATLGCGNQSDVIELLDHLWKDNYIEMEVPTTAPLRERAVFDLFCGHLTKEGVQRIEEIKQKNCPLNFKITEISVEDTLKQKESSQMEIKGSCKLDLNRLLKSDGKMVLNNNLALNGILKEIVAFLNTNGGIVIIGALEADKFSLEEIGKIHYKLVSDYYVIGIKIENENFDKYQLTIRDLISSHIDKELIGLTDITFHELYDFILCKIVINKASHKWYYLDYNFYVRDGNRTVKLEGELMDNYKKKFPR